MSAFSNFLKWMKVRFEESEDDYEEPEAEENSAIPGPGAVPARSAHPLEVVIMTPTSYGDARNGIDALAKGLVVLVVLGDNVDDETASRFVDFMSGAVYLAHGSIRLLNDNVLIVAPSAVEIDEDRLIPVSGIPLWKGPGI
jgi:cell division inhibitor SepF